MAWIESHQSVWEHAKTRKAARRLGVSPVQLVGHLHALWHWAVDHAETGNVSKYDADDLAIAARWDGDPQAFVDALTSCGPGDSAGYLEPGGSYGPPEDAVTGELVLHDWWQYAGKLIARRVRDRDRAVARRSGESPTTVAGPSDDAPQDAASRATNQPTVDQPTNPPEPDVVDEQFQAFWDAYPRHRRTGDKGGGAARHKTRQLFGRLKADERDQAVSAVANYADYCAHPDAEFPAHATTWLNEKRWERWSEAKPLQVNGALRANDSFAALDPTDESNWKRQP